MSILLWGIMATIKQRKAAKLIAENIQSVDPKTMGEILREAGYSQVSSEQPSHIINSKTFKDELEKAGISDEVLSNVLKEGLSATRAVVMGAKSEESFVDIQPDYAIRHKYLETALKVKGHAKETPPNATTINIALVEFVGDDSQEEN